MYKDLINKDFDYIVLGSSLSESSVSAYLSKLQKKVLQIDIAKLYGGDCKNYNLRDMEKVISSITSNEIQDSSLKDINIVSRITTIKEPIIDNENPRNYNFDLNPKFIYAKSKSTKELTDSNASAYIEFSSVKKVFFYYMNKFLTVPFSKSEIFISNDLELLEKQKLLNFIFAIMKMKNEGHFDVNSTIDIKKDNELDDMKLLEDIKSNLNESADKFISERYNNKIKEMILLILSNRGLTQDDFTVGQMCDQIYKFLQSVQIYDNTPFLYPQYGSSEFSQAMCRISAVYGGIFLINEKIKCDIKYNNSIEDKKEDNEISNENKESTENKGKKCFEFHINDEEAKEEFTVFTDNIIINDTYLFDKSSNVKFSPDICIEEQNKNMYRYKFTGFYIIKNITELTGENDGPYFYRVCKNDPELKNPYGFDIFEFFRNSNSVPRHRTMIQIMIMSQPCENDQKSFEDKCKEISKSFIEKRLEQIENKIKTKYSECKAKNKIDYTFIEILEEKQEEEKKIEVNKEGEQAKNEEIKDQETKEEKPKDKKEKNKELISLKPELILQYELCQKINFEEYKYIPKDNEKYKNGFIVVTKSDFVNTDLDPYYIESEKIANYEQFASLKKIVVEPDEIEKRKKSMSSESEEDNNLIDELFNEINLENEEEKKENEEKNEAKKEDENKEEVTVNKKEEIKNDEEKKDKDEIEKEKNV